MDKDTENKNINDNDKLKSKFQFTLQSRKTKPYDIEKMTGKPAVNNSQTQSQNKERKGE